MHTNWTLEFKMICSWFRANVILLLDIFVMPNSSATLRKHLYIMKVMIICNFVQKIELFWEYNYLYLLYIKSWNLFYACAI